MNRIYIAIAYYFHGDHHNLGPATTKAGAEKLVERLSGHFKVAVEEWDMTVSPPERLETWYQLAGEPDWVLDEIL